MSVSALSRRKIVLRLAALAGLLWALLAITGLMASPSTDMHAKMGQPVLPGFADRRLSASEIHFTMADERYTLVRSDNGWVMQEEDGFPVRQDRIAALAAGLETLTYGPRRTSDPSKHDQIRLGHPRDSGTGVLIEVFDASGTRSDAVLIGRKNAQLYLRRPDSDQTYRAGGELPPFYDRRSWLDFNIIDIAPDSIRSVRISDASGQSAYFARPPGGDPRSFKTAPPYENFDVASRLGLSTTALAIARFAPNGAKRATRLSSPPIARHISETFDGLEVDLRAYQESDGFWVTLRAIEAGEGARRAEAINQKVEGWAFRLPAFDWADFTPNVSDLIVNPAPAPEAPTE
ncbi:MAG: DUF4340 domain-containing protein [Pseudomonadota bacterium]